MEALAPLSDDDRKLGELGYKAEFNREMGTSDSFPFVPLALTNPNSIPPPGWMAVIGISFTAIGILT